MKSLMECLVRSRGWIWEGRGIKAFVLILINPELDEVQRIFVVGWMARGKKNNANGDVP